MKVPELINSLNVKNRLGEGVIWDGRNGLVWWTDIDDCRIYNYCPRQERTRSWATPERLGCFALVEGEDYLIGGFESGFAFFDPTTGYFEKIREIEQDNPLTRLNDGRADRQGRFWAGSMVEGRARKSEPGSLYCLNSQLECTARLGGLSISNGLCWSPDSSHMYHTDTPTGRIIRYEFDRESGAINNPLTFAETEPGCSPDGSTVDAEGYLWNAQWGGSRVVRYAPDGNTDLILPVPATQPTCVALGGSERNLLFVTSASRGLAPEELKAQPEAGNVFVYRTATSGIADPEFRRGL